MIKVVAIINHFSELLVVLHACIYTAFGLSCTILNIIVIIIAEL